MAKKAEIDRAISEVQKIYARNYFPEMKVDWKRFIDNIGHLYYPGCFRCHDGKHVSDEGKVLSSIKVKSRIEKDLRAMVTALAEMTGAEQVAS